MTLDPVTFEIVRHRLDSINDEAASTLRHVSGSQIAVESNDLNTVITTAEGRVVACGLLVLCQVVSIDLVISDIVERYSVSPGIRPGDQFLTNDPYVGTLHQPDVVLVAPVFVDDELVAWVGSTVHQADVGGPSAGGMTFGASSIFDEAIPMPPIRIVEQDVIRPDIEREYLIRSRTPELNALDLAGQVAANRGAAASVVTLCRRYGTDTIVDAMEQLITGAEHQLRQRLSSLPDGRWRHVHFLEHPLAAEEGTTIYAIRLTVTKRGSDLTMDFTESADQAPGAINSGYPALANFAMAAVLIYLCGDLPWVPGALWRVVELKSREGSIVHARWPAGLAMSTATSAQAIRVCVNACLTRMLECSDELRYHAMASCQAAGAGGGVFSGRTDGGELFAGMTLDEATGGGGARSFRDGADSSGLATSPGAACANVEVNESYLPLLYLWRQELSDSGGPGNYRGGVGCSTAVRPHGISEPVRVLSFGQGLQHPAAPGIAGGEYGRQSIFAVVPSGEAAGLLTGDGPTHLPFPGPDEKIGADEVHVGSSQGGGGYGDPIVRTPVSVADDVDAGLVSASGARRDYGVVLVAGSDPVMVDEPATEALRAARRKERIGRSPRPAAAGRGGRPIAVTLDLVDGMVCCSRCAAPIAPATEDHYPALVRRDSPVRESAPWGFDYPGGERFEIRHFFCPECGSQVDVQVSRSDEPHWRAVEPALEEPALEEPAP